MKYLILLVTFALTRAKVINRNDCGVIVNGIGHDKEILNEYVDKPYQLAIDYNTNILYYSQSTKNGNGFSLNYFNLKTNDSGIIYGVDGGFATTVDEATHTVYFGGSNGLYKLKPGTIRTTDLEVTDKNIWQLFSKDGIYFTTYPNEEAYLYKNGQVQKVSEIGNTRAMLIGVDNLHNILFYNSSGLFYYTQDDGLTTHIGDYNLNSITNNNNGDIYFSTPTGIFTFDGKTKTVKKLAMIINIYGMAVESDGSIIYGSDTKIIRLRSTGLECF